MPCITSIARHRLGVRRASVRRVFSACCFAVVVPIWALAQHVGPPRESEQFAVRGVVREQDTTAPLGGVAVTVLETGGGSGLTAKATTGADGKFSIDLEHAGHYRVSVQKSGYTFARASDATTDIELTEAMPVSSLQLSLVGSGQVSGRVIDYDTGKPAANINLVILSLIAANGRRRVGPPRTAVVTDADGEYKADGLRPGNYLVYVAPHIVGPQLMRSFSNDDLAIVDTDYEDSYWPGGLDLDSASPFTLRAGASERLGPISLRRTAYYRVHFSAPAGGCAEGESISITRIYGDGFFAGEDDLGDVLCGTDFLLRNVRPGYYKLLLELAGLSGTVRLSGISEFVVTEANLAVTVSLQALAPVSGRVLMAEGAKAPRFDNIRLGIGLMERSARLISATSATSDARGAFNLGVVEAGTERVVIDGLSAPYYVKEIRFNGVAAPEGVFTLAGPGTLEIVIDDKAAALAGTVNDGGSPVAQPYLLIVGWPPHPGNIFLSVTRITGDESGAFYAGGLAPGEYGVLAVSQTARYKIEEPGVLQRLLGSAEKVALEPGSAQNLQLKATDPLR